MKKLFFYLTLILALIAVVALVVFSISSYSEFRAMAEDKSISGADRFSKIPVYATEGMILSVSGLACAIVCYLLTGKDWVRAIIGVGISVLLLGAIISITLLLI
jgi:uncharacterized membrane protein (UPF0182 family)